MPVFHCFVVRFIYRTLNFRSKFSKVERGIAEMPVFHFFVVRFIYTTLNFRSTFSEVERGIAEMPVFQFFVVNQLTYMKSSVGNISRWVALGNETCLDVLLVSSTLSTQFTFIGNDDFCTNLVWKVGVFEFSRISRRDRVGGGRGEL